MHTIAFIPKKKIETVIFLFAAIRQGLSICLLNERNPSQVNEKIVEKIKGKFIENPRWFVSHKSNNKIAFNAQKAKFLIPTSGSLDEPKITILTYENMCLNAAEALQKIFLTKNDCYALSLPLYHVGGLAIVFRVALAKASLYIPEKEELLDQIPVNFASLVPTQLIRLLPQAKIIQKNYKCLLVGGAYLPPHIYQEAKNLPLYLTYGMTEASSQILISNKPTLIDNHYYLGWPHKHCEIKLSDNGEIKIRGKAVFLQYFNQPKQTNWFKTKDLAYFSHEFGYSFHARKDGLFISGGENIYPEEIERAIHKCGLFECVIVVPIKDNEFGERPVAFIQSNHIDTKCLINDLKKLLPKYKIPIRFFDLSKHPNTLMKHSRERLKKTAKTQIFSL